jgi:hypothetical protein
MLKQELAITYRECVEVICVRDGDALIESDLAVAQERSNRAEVAGV